MTFRAFWYGCWGGHREPIWEGSSLTCLTCGSIIPVLPQTTVRGPASIPEPVRGQPQIRAVKESKVAALKRRVG